MSAQPEALRLADELEAPVGTQSTYSAMQQAAAELRWLHASCEDYAQHKQHQDQRVLELNAQRDALLEALKEIVDAADGTGWDQLDASFSKARAAIKAVEETK